MFLFYLGDLPEGLPSCVHLFADDTIDYMAVRSDSDAKTLQKDLEALEAWEKWCQIPVYAAWSVWLAMFYKIHNGLVGIERLNIKAETTWEIKTDNMASYFKAGQHDIHSEYSTLPSHSQPRTIMSSPIFPKPSRNRTSFQLVRLFGRRR